MEEIVKGCKNLDKIHFLNKNQNEKNSTDLPTSLIIFKI